MCLYNYIDCLCCMMTWYIWFFKGSDGDDKSGEEWTEAEITVRLGTEK